MHLSKGCIQVYTGEGKGKTTAALGLAFRSLGRGFRVFFLQFMKAPDTSGEHFAAEKFGSALTIRAAGRKGFISKTGPSPEDLKAAAAALAEARQALTGREYDLVVLDEINVALNLGLFGLEEVLELIRLRPEEVELVLTGRNAHPEILARADLVSEIKPVKHYFESGTPARKGIEY